MLSLQRTLPVQIERLRHQLALVQKNEAFLLACWGLCRKLRCLHSGSASGSSLVERAFISVSGKYFCESRAHTVVLAHLDLGSSSPCRMFLPTGCL
jgi:hypothetical protein